MRARRGDRGIVSCERPACEHANNRGRPRSSVEGAAGCPVRPFPLTIAIRNVRRERQFRANSGRWPKSATSAAR